MWIVLRWSKASLLDRAPLQASPARQRGGIVPEMCRQEILIAIEQANRRVVRIRTPEPRSGQSRQAQAECPSVSWR